MTEIVDETPPVPVGEIRITINEHNASYDSNMSPPEIVFWIDMIKHMICSQIAGKESPPSSETPETS